MDTHDLPFVRSFDVCLKGKQKSENEEQSKELTLSDETETTGSTDQSAEILG
jgi:hypothetical protein